MEVASVSGSQSPAEEQLRRVYSTQQSPQRHEPHASSRRRCAGVGASRVHFPATLRATFGVWGPLPLPTESTSRRTPLEGGWLLGVSLHPVSPAGGPDRSSRSLACEGPNLPLPRIGVKLQAVKTAEASRPLGPEQSGLRGQTGDRGTHKPRAPDGTRSGNQRGPRVRIGCETLKTLGIFPSGPVLKVKSMQGAQGGVT